MHTQVQCAPEIHNDFWQKKIFLFFKNNFTRLNPCKFMHHKSHLKPFLRYLPCTVHREYFSIILNVKKCTLYLIKYGKLEPLSLEEFSAQSILVIRVEHLKLALAVILSDNVRNEANKTKPGPSFQLQMWAYLYMPCNYAYNKTAQLKAENLLQTTCRFSPISFHSPKQAENVLQG